MVSKHIFENGVIVADCSGGSVQYRLKDLVCHFNGKPCSRSGWCVRKSRKHNVDGSRLRLMDVCSRYPVGSGQLRF